MAADPDAATSRPAAPHLKVISSGGRNPLEPATLGARLRGIRHSNAWTLEEASRRTGVAKSTLSKIENEQMSPTLDVVQRLASGLGVAAPQLFRPPRDPGGGGRRAVTRADDGRPRATGVYEHMLLADDMVAKAMIPMRTRVRARRFEDFDDWIRHDGEEFLFVLSGELVFLSEYYEALTLAAGDSVYYDARMGHACLSVGPQDADILWVTAP